MSQVSTIAWDYLAIDAPQRQQETSACAHFDMSDVSSVHFIVSCGAFEKCLFSGTQSIFSMRIIGSLIFPPSVGQVIQNRVHIRFSTCFEC